jgi:3D (Asp-Asp-Asp) domain-containing protein
MLYVLESITVKRVRAFLCCSILLSILSGCVAPPINKPSRSVTIEATGYCPCGKCCGWERSWIPPFRPLHTSGPQKGQPKKVGITASGKKARKGTIAADTRYYGFGTVMKIPGYGLGRVEDRGGAIKGPTRIDLFFKTHEEALEWGRRRVQVRIWRP